MKVRLTVGTEADLGRIAAYLQARSPRGAHRVEAHLQAAFRLIEAYPGIGQKRRRGIRRLVLTRYPYLIFYGVDDARGEVRVFTIRHAARRPFG